MCAINESLGEKTTTFGLVVIKIHDVPRIDLIISLSISKKYPNDTLLSRPSLWMDLSIKSRPETKKFKEDCRIPSIHTIPFNIFLLTQSSILQFEPTKKWWRKEVELVLNRKEVSKSEETTKERKIEKISTFYTVPHCFCLQFQLYLCDASINEIRETQWEGRNEYLWKTFTTCHYFIVWKFFVSFFFIFLHFISFNKTKTKSLLTYFSVYSYC